MERERALKTLHIYLRDLTRRVDLIVVIGYAFHDDQVNSEMVGAVNGNNRVKVLVLDPGIQGLGLRGPGVVPPFQHLTYGGQFECQWSRFEWLERCFGNQSVSTELPRVISDLTSQASS